MCLVRQLHFLLLASFLICYSVLGESATNSASNVSTAISNNIVTVTPNHNSLVLGPKLQIFEDASKQWRIDQLTQKHNSHLFQPTTEEIPVYGWTSSAYWARITLQAAKNDETWLLEIPYVFMDEVQFFRPTVNGSYDRVVVGDHYPFVDREFENNHFIFPVKLSIKPKTYYFRFTTTSVMNLNMSLWEPLAFAEKANQEMLVIGLFFGVMLVMIAYNGFIYLSVRDKSYLFYVGYISSITFCVAGLHGLSSQYLWPQATWWSDRNPLMFLAFSGFFGVQFTQNFLQTKSYTPLIHRVLSVFAIIYLCFLPGTLWGPYTPVTRVVNFLGIPFSLISITSGIVILRQGSRYARFYLLAWSSLAGSVVMYELALFGILPEPFTFVNFVQIGFVLLVVLLSLGLADRIKILEAEVSEAQEKAIQNLKKADEFKDEFLANTSHELRTPLNAIVGLSESLMTSMKGEIRASGLSHLNMIMTSAKRLSTLVNDILDFSQLKRHQLFLQKRPVDLYVITDVVIALSKPLVLDKSIVVTNGIEKNDAFVYADENRLQQILFNLIGNAIKFTERGKIDIYARYDGSQVIISVADTGVGINKEKFETIFKMFEQMDGTISREYGGTGLGLTITKKLVELHGGHIWLQSSVGKGSVFSFSMARAINDESYEFTPSSVQVIEPMATDSEPANNVLDDQEDWVLEGVQPEKGDFFRILIVDDEPINRQILIDHLSIKNYETTEAEDGLEALRLLENEGPFDLVLLDIMMPKMSGYEVSQRIRANYPLHELPIIFLTARNQVSDLISGFVSGGNDFIAKPVLKNELYARVNAHLQLKDINSNLEYIVKERTAALSSLNNELETLDGIVRSINREVDLDALLDTFLTAGITLFSSAQKGLYLQFEEKKQTFFCAACRGYDIVKLRSVTGNWSDFIVHYTEESERLKKGIFIVKPKKSMPGWSDAVDFPQPESALAVAMQVDDKLHGFLMLYNFSDLKAFDGTDVAQLSRFREHAVSALSKARLLSTLKLKNLELQDAYHALEEVSLTDQLTSMKNRRYLLTHLESDVAISLRAYEDWKGGAVVPTESDLLFFMLDLDYFKKINDNYGHAAGDQVLMQLKSIFEKVFRLSDYFVRWGGEEFLIVARFSNCQQASMLAERLRLAISEHHFDVGNGVVLRETCSIGFACYPFKPASPALLSWTKVVEIADYCLYMAKKSQRNAWVGMLTNERTKSEMLLERIREDANKLVKKGELQLVTSIEDRETIVWK